MVQWRDFLHASPRLVLPVGSAAAVVAAAEPAEPGEAEHADLDDPGDRAVRSPVRLGHRIDLARRVP